MTLQQLVMPAIHISLFALVFSLGLRATFGDVAHLLRRPWLLVRSILSMNLAMPVLAMAAALLFPISHAVKVALVALAASPVPPILPGKQTKAGGSRSYAVSLLVVASVAAILFVPAVVHIAGAVFGADYHMPPKRIVPIVLVSVIVPLVLGVTMQHVGPALAGRLAQPISRLATLLLVIACLPVIFTSSAEFWALVGDGVIVFLVLFTLAGLAIGHLLGGPEPGHRTVLALATGTRHPGVAIAIASLNFPDEKAVLVVVLWHLIIGTVASIPYVKWRKAEHAAAARDAPPEAGTS